MQGLRKMLIEEERHLEKILNVAKLDLSNVPDGHLRISKDKNKLRYYHCCNDRNGIYIPKDNTQLPKQLAQKSYQISVVKKVEERLKQIRKIIKDYSDDEIEKIYTSMHKERQALITPVEPTWNQTISEWYEKEYQGKEFQEGTSVILTDKGERVRSKSEKIIADYLYRNNILYKYEKPLYLKGYGTVYPDFTFLSKKTCKEIYWEHEGRMDDPVYAASAIKKIKTYEENGIYTGENLILTFETQNIALNTVDIERNVERYLT